MEPMAEKQLSPPTPSPSGKGGEGSYAITLDDVLAAAARVRPWIHQTPVLTCSTISGMMNTEREGHLTAEEEGTDRGKPKDSLIKLHFKAEVFQKSGSFKIRGASNAILSMFPPDAANEGNGSERGVVTHSSGNHAGAVALAAKMRGIPAHIVVPRNTPRVKTDAVRAYGGELYLCEPTIDSREAECDRIQRESGAAFVHPYNDPRVMAGQGTIAVEFLDQVPELDAILVPISGGGMISGIAVAAKGLKPGIRIIAAEPSGTNDAADVAKAKAAGTLPIPPPPKPATIADGLQGRLGNNTWPIVRDLVDAVVVVDEKEIVAAMRLLYLHAKVAVEPSGAVGLAAALKAAGAAAGGGDGGGGGGPLGGCKNIGIVLCGGNVDLDAKGFWNMDKWQPAS